MFCKYPTQKKNPGFLPTKYEILKSSPIFLYNIFIFGALLYLLSVRSNNLGFFDLFNGDNIVISRYKFNL